MNRRGFLGALAAALVAPDPEQLLWRPGARLISIPAAKFPDFIIFRETISIAEFQLRYLPELNRMDILLGPPFPDTRPVLTLRRPPRWGAR